MVKEFLDLFHYIGIYSNKTTKKDKVLDLKLKELRLKQRKIQLLRYQTKPINQPLKRSLTNI